ALGTNYYLLDEYDKATRSFARYVSLRPSDFYAKYTSVQIYMKLKAYDKAAPLLHKLLEEYPSYTFLKSLLFECDYYSGRKKEARKTAWELARTDSTDKHFTLGIYYSLEAMTDSAVYFYKKAAEGTPGCGICYNNIGHAFFMGGRNDSARRYFQISIASDSSYASAFPMFNLASIDAQEGKYEAAINGFFASYEKVPSHKEAFFSHFDLYFNKRWVVTDSSLFKTFQKKPLQLELQYMDLVSVFYCVLRDSARSYNPGALDTLYKHMLDYKLHEPWSWYHHACWKAQQKDNSTALASLQKALALGFGQYEMLQCDGDLAPLRETPGYKALLKKYFPDRKTKR
ncbi:MAG: tetratricopeptide repeat protein, partial [Chitinophagaceae bacterium]